MRSLLLSGFSGTGKTTVGPLVAAELGLPFVDTDEEIVRRTDTSIPALWRELGEGGFRELEAGLVREILGVGAARVVALGGGTLTGRALRHEVLEKAFVVTLTARPSVLAARLREMADRPLLVGSDLEARIEALLEPRLAAYAECHLRVATDELTPERAAAAIAAACGVDRVVVPLGTRSYTVTFVDDAPGALSSAVLALSPSSVVLVSDTNVQSARDAWLRRAWATAPDVRVTEVTLAPGEENKTLVSVAEVWRRALGGGIDRRAVVVALGGGVVGDLAGFAASTLLRGLRVVQVPTTLLAMVDASVGGKTGFDLPDGKNLIGTFHQPSAVVVDLDHLTTLPARERAAGLAEVAKIALACDEALWVSLEESADALAAGDFASLAPVVRRAVELKVRLVRDDEREAGPRVVLNLGHTVGHSLEAGGGYSRYLHGEAVALGLVAECAVAEAMGGPPGVTARVRRLLARLGLPTEISSEELARSWHHVAHDKKRVSGGSIALPLVVRVGEARPETVSLRELADALGLAGAAALPR